MIARLIASLLVLTAAADHAPAQPTSDSSSAGAFDFKGARLGMTLAEWKALKPDLNVFMTTIGVNKGSQPLKIWCSDTQVPISKTDTMPAAPLTQAEKNAVVLTCRYGRLTKISSIVLVAPAYLNIGDGYTNEVVYKFSGDRLYEISIEGRVNLYTGIMEGLRAKFGPPAEQDSGTVTNGYGSNFPHTTKTWARGDAAIRLEAPYKKIDRMKVTYFVPSAWQRILDAQPKGQPASTKM